MNYLLKSSKRHPVRSFVVGLLIVCVPCLLLGVLLRKPLASVLTSIVAPVASARVYETSLVEYVTGFFTYHTTLQKKIDLLEEENGRLQDRVAMLESEERLLGAFASSSLSLIPAHVVMRPPFTPFDVITISKGSNVGILVGANVYPEGRLVPIGTVSAVAFASAEVKLFSSPGNEFLFALGTSSENWRATGMGGGMFEARIPRSYPVAIGENIRMSRGDTAYSSVVDIISDPANPFQIVQFLLPVAPSKIERVGVSKQ